MITDKDSNMLLNFFFFFLFFSNVYTSWTCIVNKKYIRGYAGRVFYQACFRSLSVSCGFISLYQFLLIVTNVLQYIHQHQSVFMSFSSSFSSHINTIIEQFNLNRPCCNSLFECYFNFHYSWYHFKTPRAFFILQLRCFAKNCFEPSSKSAVHKNIN